MDVSDNEIIHFQVSVDAEAEKFNERVLGEIFYPIKGRFFSSVSILYYQVLLIITLIFNHNLVDSTAAMSMFTVERERV